jgi:hypothetical protein
LVARGGTELHPAHSPTETVAPPVPGDAEWNPVSTRMVPALLGLVEEAGRGIQRARYADRSEREGDKNPSGMRGDPNTGLIETAEEATQREQAEENRRAQEREGLRRETELALTRRNVGAATVGVGFGVLTLGVLIWQTWENHRSVSVAERSVTVSEKAVQVAQDQLRASEKQGKDAAESLRLDQRAWIGFIQNDVAFSRGLLTQSLLFSNSGRTPARNVRMRSASKGIPTGTKLTPDYGARNPIGEGPSSSSITPGGSKRLLGRPLRPDADMLAKLQSGAWVLYHFGEVTYEDVFGQPHRTTFCVFVLPSLAEAGDCGEYNDAD